METSIGVLRSPAAQKRGTSISAVVGFRAMALRAFLPMFAPLGLFNNFTSQQLIKSANIWGKIKWPNRRSSQLIGVYRPSFFCFGIRLRIIQKVYEYTGAGREKGCLARSWNLKKQISQPIKKDHIKQPYTS